MLAFAGNSLLCRMALRSAAIDPASFTILRLLAGAATLALILVLRGTPIDIRRHGHPGSALLLFLYAAGFSFAYVSLDAASGALLLFGFVQLSMIVAALLRGERPTRIEWLGWAAAVTGLGWFLLPGAGAPSLQGAVLMATAGVAWGLYSLRGRLPGAATQTTAANFVLALLFVPVLLPLLQPATITPTGVWLAVASGALTSGIGYVIWYAALKHLQALQAALLQLSVPVLAALGGILLLGEAPTARLLTAGLLLLSGILFALLGKSRITS
jgi:drug/metabolite transporter (DMT)-like permease